MSGADMRITQKLMRHSDPRLTSNLYTDPYLLVMVGAVNQLKTVGDKWGTKTCPNTPIVSPNAERPKSRKVV